MYGLDVKQFREKIIDPVCRNLHLYSRAASNLLLGTALQESNLSYIKQINGPAIGVYQMEPNTFYDIYDNFLVFNKNLRELVNDFCINDMTPDQMAGNLYYATAMARVHYWRVKEPLPDALDEKALAAYWKKYYNTVNGKGVVLSASVHFRNAIEIV